MCCYVKLNGVIRRVESAGSVEKVMDKRNNVLEKKSFDEVLARAMAKLESKGLGKLMRGENDEEERVYSTIRH